MQDYEKLQVFQRADALVLAIYAATRRFPDDEKFGLTSQLRRAAVSIATNIAEGARRATGRDFAHFLVLALSSGSEVAYLLKLAGRLDYLSKEEGPKLRHEAEQICRMLQALYQRVVERSAFLKSSRATGRASH